MEEPTSKLNPDNKYFPELNKFLGKECVCVDMLGEKHKGILKGFFIQHMNIILMTPTEKIMLRNWVSLTRIRKK